MVLDSSMLMAILPEILLLTLGTVVLILDLVLPKEQHRNLGWVTAAGMALVMLLSLPARPGTEPEIVWGGLVSYDWMSFTFKLLVIFGAGITALFAMDVKQLGVRGEFYVLMIVSTIGMAFMACALDLTMLYLAIETTSIPLYILAGFFILDDYSSEAGFKYLLFGAMSSAVLLYGFSLVYGFSGTTNLAVIAQSLIEGQVSFVPLMGSMLLIFVGFLFKISVVPMQFWAPDVYTGAPTPVAGFLSTASKAVAFAAFVRVLLLIFPFLNVQWSAILASLSVATMTLGNLIAIPQRNIKRMLAFSSIAHAGYALIGVVAVGKLGLTSMVYYLIAYLITNLLAFGVVTVYGRAAGSDEMTAYYGMSRRSPWLALAMLVAFLSLAGMPPFAGFVAKVFVFAAAVDAGLIWLAVVGVLNAIIGLYYYLTVLKYVYLYRSEDDEKPVPMTRPLKLALVILTAGIILVGTALGPWFSWATNSISWMFS